MHVRSVMTMFYSSASENQGMGLSVPYKTEDVLFCFLHCFFMNKLPVQFSSH